MSTLRTQVAIIGAGPAGLTLAHLLHLEGIQSVVVESHTREYVESRVRAGVLEQGTVEILRESGVGERMNREGLLHHGVELRFARKRHRIDFQDLVGKSITVYAQQEVVKDLIAARLGYGAPILFEAEALKIVDLTDHPSIRFRHAGTEHTLSSDYIAGCDGFHGICRPAIPADLLQIHEHTFPFAWLGILARVPPASGELIYTYHERGFALMSMRSPEVSRLYLQCAPEEEISHWPDDRIWEELRARMATADGFVLNDGPISQKGITPMRGFVAQPMQFGKLFLLGDAAHIVPPTGAKGLNLAVADVRVLTRALVERYKQNKNDSMLRYSELCLDRVWRAQRFFSWMTTMLHRFPGEGAFSHQLHLAELDYVTRSRAASITLAENYVGLPFETPGLF
jgi:p-hydroxybenzoate 3-monooxygenase